MKQRAEKGVQADFAEVLRDIQYRDEQDSSRAAAPLKQAEDAVLVDSSDLSFEETFQLLCEIVVQRLAVRQEGEPCES